MGWLYALVALGTGGLLAIQGVMNSVGSKATSTSLIIVGLSVVQAIPALIFMLMKSPVSTIPGLTNHGLKWFIPAGLIGIIGIAVVSVSISKVGALPVFVLVILGQIVGSTFADKFGLFGIPKVPVTPLRILSILVITTGVILLMKSGFRHK